MTEVLTHEYRNESGDLILTVTRTREPGQKSRFKRAPRGVTPDQVPLYRIDEWLPEARRRAILVVEGEADADALWAAGVPATTSGGANSWRPHHTEQLKRAGAQVDLIADADETGHKAAHHIKQQLEAAGVPVLALTLDDGCKDIEEHLDAGHRLQDLVPLPPWLDIEQAPSFPSPAKMTAFDGPLGDLALAMAEYAQPNPEALLFSLYALYGALLPIRARGAPFVVLGGPQSTNLYVAVVAGAGVGKGQSWGPVQRAMQLADPASCDRIRTHFGSGEALIDFVSPTLNKEGEIVDPGDPRLMYHAPELQGTLATMAREGATLGAVLRQAWDRGTLDTASRQHGIKQVKVNHVSVVGHITPADLSMMRPVDIANGFGSRFLLVMVKRARKMSILDRASPEIEGAWGAALGKCLLRGRRIGEVVPDRSFAEVWDAYDLKCGDEEHPSPLEGLLARRPVQALRLALIGAVAEGRDRLHEDDAHRGIAMVEYAAESAQILFGPGGLVQGSLQAPDVTEAEYDRILAGLQAAGRDGLTRNQIRVDVLNRRGSGRTAAKTNELINRLVIDGAARWKDGKSGNGGQLVMT